MADKETKTRKNETTDEQTYADTKNTDRTIPYARFKQVVAERNNLQSDLAEFEAQVDQWKNKYQKTQDKIEDLKQYKTELETIKQKRFEKNKTEWEKKKNLFEVEEGDPKYEKVQKIKHRFKFGDGDKGLEPSDIAQNLEILKTYEEIDYFQTQKESTNFNSKKAKGKPTKEGEFGGYGSLAEWSRHDWKAAHKWMEENK